jgi:hypothetical protein
MLTVFDTLTGATVPRNKIAICLMQGVTLTAQSLAPSSPVVFLLLGLSPAPLFGISVATSDRSDVRVSLQKGHDRKTSEALQTARKDDTSCLLLDLLNELLSLRTLLYVRQSSCHTAGSLTRRTFLFFMPKVLSSTTFCFCFCAESQLQ